MTTTKRGLAINGDLFELRHDQLELSVPFTTFIDVVFEGVTHQIFAAADRTGFDYSTPTGEFTVGGHRGLILEQLDTVETQVRHRYQALVELPAGVLSAYSHDDVDRLLQLVGALGPQSNTLGVTLAPDANVEFSSAPKIALTVDDGILEVTPLTAEVLDQLPEWAGSSVDGGELYAGRFVDDSPYLTLVTDTCRVLGLPAVNRHEEMTETLAALHAHWTSRSS